MPSVSRALSSSTVRVDSPTKTHGNVPDHDKDGDDLEDTSVASIPSGTGHFEGTIKPIGLDLVANMEDADGHVGVLQVVRAGEQAIQDLLEDFNEHDLE